MFGTGNDPTVEQFQSLFNASYYTYNLGTKTTVGAITNSAVTTIPITFPATKNLFDPSCSMINYSAYSISNDIITQSGSDGRGWTNDNFPSIHLAAGTYTLSCSDGNIFNLRTSIDNYEANT
mgnify:CR=1 FL=1